MRNIGLSVLALALMLLVSSAGVAETLEVHVTSSNASISTDGEYVRGVRLHPTAAGASVALYAADATTELDNWNLKLQIHGPVTHSTNDVAFVDGLLPNGDAIYCGTGVYAVVSSGTAEVFILNRGRALVENIGSTTISGFDNVDNKTVSISANGEATVSERFAAYLLTAYPSAIVRKQ